MKNKKNFVPVFKILTARVLILSISVMSVIALNQLQAQDEFEKVEVLDHPRYSLTQRFNVDSELTFLPLDAYYKPLLVDLAASYQFNDFFSWEVIRGGLPIYKHNTKLNSQIESAVQKQTGDTGIVIVDDDRMKKLQYRVSSTGFLNLLYSKSNFFNKGVVYHYWQAGFGASYWDFKKGSKKAQKQYGVDLVLRARFFLSEQFMVNLRLAQTVGFNSKAPKNIISLGTGAGFAF